ncbi:MAG: hypothetical protein ABI539_12725 [Acidobacteriota bacterium]
MNLSLIFLDIGPSVGTAALAAGAIFFLVFAAAAFIAFRLLKRTVGLAIRAIVVLVILIIAVVGSASLWFYSGGSSTPRPANRRVR